MAETTKPVVLVMDNDMDVRQYAFTFFDSRQFNTETASTIEEARRAIHDIKGTIALLADIRMQGGEKSYGLFRYVQETAGHRVLPYAWTGDKTKEVAREAIEAGALRIFTKYEDDEIIPAWIQADAKRLEQAGVDELTGLDRFPNFERSAVAQLNTMRRHKGRKGSTFSVIFIDIDNFKQFNDRYGHLTGDDALKALAEILQGHVHASDLVCRKGGDEFLIGLALDEARARARSLQIQKDLGNQCFFIKTEEDTLPAPILVSVGVGSVTGDRIDNPEAALTMLIKEADAGKREDKKNKAARQAQWLKNVWAKRAKE